MRYIGSSILTKVLAAAAFCSMAVSAHADTLSCTATVKAVTVHPWGNVYVEFNGLGGGPTPLCNVISARGSGDPGIGDISAEVCRSWLSTFLTAKSSGQSITLGFSYPGTAPACSALSFAWYSPNPFPYWISLAN